MKKACKLIARPSEINACTLIIATMERDFSWLSKRAYYVMRDKKGNIHRVYARNESAFYEKWIYGRKKYHLPNYSNNNTS